MHRFSVVALCLLCAISGAQAAKSSDSGVDCASNDLAQVEMNGCASQAFQKKDHELNVMYGQLVKQWDADSVRQLQAAQRAWLQFRDLECIFEAPDAAGSLGPYETANCLTELTKERIADFRRMLRAAH